jgi:hypothetical protein
MVTGKSKSKSYITQDRNFAKFDAASCHLALYLDSETLIFGVLDRKSDQVICCGRLANEGKSKKQFFLTAIEQHAFLSQEYQSATATLGRVNTTITPSALVNESSATEVLSFSYGKPITKSRLVPLANPDIVVVHEVDSDLEDEVKRIHPNVQWHSYAALLLNAVQRRHHSNSGCILYLEVFRSHVVILAWKDTMMELYNWFSISNENDVLYYCMNVCQQLRIELPSCKVYVSGEVEKGGPTFNLLQKYIPDLAINYGLDHVKLAAGLMLENKQEMSPAFNQFACVS